MKYFLILGWLGFWHFTAVASLEAKTAEEWYEAGFEHSLAGNSERAIQSYLNALNLKPDWPEPHHSLGVLYYRIKDGVQAVHHLRQAEKLYLQSSSPQATKNLSIVRENLEKTYERFGLSSEEFEQVDSLSPSKERLSFSGTGFFWGNQGYLLTLHHFVQEAKTIQIRFADGATATAQLVKSFFIYDLALLQLTDSSVAGGSYLNLGDSSLLEVGDSVFTVELESALDNGAEYKPTQGRIMALRSVQSDDNFFEIEPSSLLKSDGSPLLNSLGQVVGIHVSKTKTMEAFQAIGREPKGEIALKSSYIQKVLSGMEKVNVDLEKKQGKPRVLSQEEMLKKVKRSVVRIETSQ